MQENRTTPQITFVNHINTFHYTLADTLLTVNDR